MLVSGRVTDPVIPKIHIFTHYSTPIRAPANCVSASHSAERSHARCFRDRWRWRVQKCWRNIFIYIYPYIFFFIYSYIYIKAEISLQFLSLSPATTHWWQQKKSGWSETWELTIKKTRLFLYSGCIWHILPRSVGTTPIHSVNPVITQPGCHGMGFNISLRIV